MKSTYFFACLLLIGATVLLGRCKKENPKPLPASKSPIETKPATVYPDGGVTLNGQINTVPANLSEYGFQLSTDSLFRGYFTYKIITPAAVGAIKTDINTGLRKNIIYYYRAYSTANSIVTTYNVISFNSSGPKKIVTTSVVPLKADIGDTITIKGKNFAGQNLFVQFGDQTAAATILSDSLLTCIVPLTINQPSTTITIQYSGATDTAAAKFSLNTPVITNFTSIATFRDTLVINGNYFGYQNSLNQVSFGNAAATVVSSSRKQLKVIVPDNVPNSYTNISIKAQLQTVVSSAKFQIRQPVITAVTSSGYVNSPVKITGKYFHPVISKNIVYNETVQAQLTSGNTTNLNYSLPNIPYPQRKATITLKLLDYTITYSPDLIIKDKWVVVNDKVPFNTNDPAGAFTINNLSYVIAGSQDYTDNTQYLWKFNPADFSWQKISIPINFTGGKVTTNGSKAYLYTLSATNNFWEFDPAANTWTQKADYPAAIRNWGTMFAIGSNVYLGLGSSSQSMGLYVTDDSFYQYNVNANSWQQIAAYPDPLNFGMRNRASAFVVNNIAYVGCGATNTGMLQFYAYSAATGSWTSIRNFPDARTYTTSFKFGSDGFIATGTATGRSPTRDCFKYSPAIDTWTHLPDKIGCTTCDAGLEMGFSFVNNGYVYVGGGEQGPGIHQLLQAAGSGL